jgi:hypothetical protein
MSGRFFRRPLAVLTGLVLCGGATLTAVAASGGAAYASGLTEITLTLQPMNTEGDSPWGTMNLDTNSASTSPGAGIDDWIPDNNADQQWTLIEEANVGGLYEDEIQNVQSDMCITTDNSPGDTVEQEPCTSADNQLWLTAIDGSTGSGGGDTIQSVSSGLYLEVYGDYDLAGGNIDTWYQDDGPNQQWGAWVDPSLAGANQSFGGFIEADNSGSANNGAPLYDTSNVLAVSYSDATPLEFEALGNFNYYIVDFDTGECLTSYEYQGYASFFYTCQSNNPGQVWHTILNRDDFQPEYIINGYQLGSGDALALNVLGGISSGAEAGSWFVQPGAPNELFGWSAIAP